MKRNILKANVDFLNGPILKGLIAFAIPVLISNLFQQLYNTVDTMIVGHYLGDSSLAAIGSCTSIYDLLVGFALGIGNGLAIVTSRSFGSKNEELLKRSVAAALIIGFGSALLITLIGTVSLKPLLSILNTPADIINESYSYISVVVLFTSVMFAYNLCAGLMRSIGNAIAPLIFLVISSVLNIFLDVVFITQFNMGVAGAAVATVLAQGISVVLCVIYIFKKTQLLIPQKAHFAYEKELYNEMIGQGYSMGFMGSIVSAGSVILQYGINGLGTLTIAGHTAARKMYMFFLMPFIALGVSISTFVGQNRGANQPKRIREAIIIGYKCDVALAAAMTVILAFLAPTLIKTISGSSEAIVINNGAAYLRFVAPFYAVLGVLLQTRNALQGIGQKLLPLISSVIEFIGKVLFVIIFIPKFQYAAVIACEPMIWIVMTAQLLLALWNNDYIKNAK